MRFAPRPVVVHAPLQRDVEVRRWYCDGAARCLVLTKRGRLLAPAPVFGPSAYRLVAYRVSRADADAFAYSLGFEHERELPPRDWRLPRGPTFVASRGR